MTSFSNISDVVLSSGLTTFSKVSLFMTGLVGLMFIIRVLILQARFANTYEYVEFLTDIFCYYALIFLFPVLVRLIFELSNTLAETIRFVPNEKSREVIQQFLTLAFYNLPFFKIASSIGEYIGPVLAYGFYTISAVLLIGIAPVVIFYSTLMGYSSIVEKYFSSIVAISLWPVLWNLIGLIGQELTKHLSDSTLEVVIFGFIIQIVQVLSPMICVALFTSLNPTRAVNKAMGMESKL